jgi:large subunit ribosomal protein L22
MMEARAVLKKIKTSSQKLNLVAAMIRGMPVDEALNQLRFSKRKVANDAYKAVFSAASNAENNLGLDYDDLYIKEAFVGKNMTMRRFRARARGRGAKIFKPYANLTIVVAEKTAVSSFDNAITAGNDDADTKNEVSEQVSSVSSNVATAVVSNTDNATQQQQEVAKPDAPSVNEDQEQQQGKEV